MQKKNFKSENNLLDIDKVHLEMKLQENELEGLYELDNIYDHLKRNSSIQERNQIYQQLLEKGFEHNMGGVQPRYFSIFTSGVNEYFREH